MDEGKGLGGGGRGDLLDGWDGWGTEHCSEEVYGWRGEGKGR